MSLRFCDGLNKDFLNFGAWDSAGVLIYAAVAIILGIVGNRESFDRVMSISFWLSFGSKKAMHHSAYLPYLIMRPALLTRHTSVATCEGILVKRESVPDLMQQSLA